MLVLNVLLGGVMWVDLVVWLREFLFVVVGLLVVKLVIVLNVEQYGECAWWLVSVVYRC